MEPEDLFDLLRENPFPGVSVHMEDIERGGGLSDDEVLVLTYQTKSGVQSITYTGKKWVVKGSDCTILTLVGFLAPDAGPIQAHQEVQRVIDVLAVAGGYKSSAHLADLAQVADALGAPADTQLSGLVSRIKTTRVNLEQYVRKMQQADANADEIKAVFGKAPMSNHAELVSAAKRARRAEVESARDVDLDLLEQVDRLLSKNKVPTHYDNGEPLSRAERIAYLDRRTSLTT